jgi:hypothetical protein
MGRRELKDLAAEIHRDRGHALAGEIIIGQARDIGRPIVVPGTSTHKMQEIVLRSNVLCVIDRPFRLVGPVLKIKKK